MNHTWGSFRIGFRMRIAKFQTISNLIEGFCQLMNKSDFCLFGWTLYQHISTLLIWLIPSAVAIQFCILYISYSFDSCTNGSVFFIPSLQRIIWLNGAFVGRWAWRMYPHADPSPGARLQRSLQSRRQAPCQRLLRQVCSHLEHSGLAQYYYKYNHTVISVLSSHYI